MRFDKATVSGKHNFDKIPDDTYGAVLCGFFDVGKHQKVYAGQATIKRMVLFYFEINTPHPNAKFEGNYKIHIEQAMSMAPKSNMRRIIEGILGKTFQSDEEIAEFDTDSIIGSQVFVTVTTSQTGFQTITNVTKAPKGMVSFNPEKLYLGDEITEYAKKKKEKAIEEIAEPSTLEDDVPF